MTRHDNGGHFQRGSGSSGSCKIGDTVHRQQGFIGARIAPALNKLLFMPALKYRSSPVLLMLLVLLSGASGTASGDAAGSDLAKAIYDRADGRDFSGYSVMTLTEQKRKPRYRKLYTYRLDRKNGETWSLIRFTEPPDVDGTGLLTLNKPGSESNQWVYLPALDRARRISSSRKGGHFVGSDLYYEDLRKREVNQDHHRILGTGKVSKMTTTLLESIPVDPDNSTYSKRVSWIHMKTLIPLQVDYYTAGKEQPVKRMKVNKIKKLQGYWTVLDSTISDLEDDHQTRMTTSATKYDQKLPEKLFTRRALSDQRLEEEFRP